jgi:hypothetical protein
MAASPGPPSQRSTPFLGAAPDYRMRLAGLGVRFAAGTVNQTSPTGETSVRWLSIRPLQRVLIMAPVVAACTSQPAPRLGSSASAEQSCDSACGPRSSG